MTCPIRTTSKNCLLIYNIQHNNNRDAWGQSCRDVDDSRAHYTNTFVLFYSCTFLRGCEHGTGMDTGAPRGSGLGKEGSASMPEGRW